MPFIISKPNNPRGLDATILADKANQHGLTGTVFNSITTAYQNLKAAEDTDLIYMAAVPLWLQKYNFLFLLCLFKKQPYICTHNEMKIIELY
jgi:hypothetical protein